ncbi:N-acetyl-gamma-glutamyl-phosphate reductase [Sphingomicrobium clamense]|uniref:N-acetyl-gamma-glutamyl-phosphate reductase n=1 Tax=Sphingomicrobium clamense TaxID=2851013 RepID=A0ABS6V708_9SPHN|nr:N-acetyl-gamma-glutamyl-phosphate reductase [Sphingomicrobium sp. B8]MBW0145347.1 N-acetyl-gamma-glutamyl-phosphate reductase [Sphingomicrobium sp. B8]
MNAKRTLILGASGYAGGELLRLMAAHPLLAPSILCGSSEAGQSLGTVHPHLAMAYPDAQIFEYDAAMLDEVDFVMAVLPHGMTQSLSPAILDAGVPFVDLGADFRLASADDYATWYGESHSAPDLLDAFVYGIPELNRDAIKNAKAVAAAGCYATAAILTLKPLVDAGLIAPGSITIDGMSGVSGAGKAPSAKTHFDHVHGSLSAYGLLNHRHTGEMQMALGQELLFTPHLVPMDRGILVTCNAVAADNGDPLEALKAAYADEPFVQVSDTPPATKAVAGTNAVHVTARRCERTGRILAIGAIDNLGKGAAGQMIQCANLMLGLDETTGLTTAGVWP